LEVSAAPVSNGLAAVEGQRLRAESVADRLPRLLVVSDVNVERTGGGALALYRLLCTYPVNRLLIISYPTANWPGRIERLPGAAYQDLSYRIPRFIFNRLNPFWPVFMAKYITRRTHEVLGHAQAFQPDAILSVAHDYLWFVADRVAATLGLPLHLILHDDWPHLQSLAARGWIRHLVVRACEAMARRVLRRAAGVYAVSPNMAERYQRDYGVPCRVLYPSRGEDSLAPAVRVRPKVGEPLVVAYAGMIHQGWTADALRALAGVLATMNGRLDLYGPYSDEIYAKWGMIAPNIKRLGFFPSARDMMQRVAASAHVLFVPAAFTGEERRNVATLFPSKLADYTAMGLPLLIWGPSYSSAARWAFENPGAAELVTDPNPASLHGPLRRLADPVQADRCATAAVAAGMRDFDPQVVRGSFWTALAGGPCS
jgi:glycosyltransferase involved in cell wall biosynthesis